MSYTEIKITNNGKVHEFSLHTMLKDNLDIIKAKQKHDWDFKILISGDGLTRVGKTTLASQIALYLDNDMDETHFCYDGGKVRELAISKGKGRAIIYDEAKEGLDSKKAMQTYSQNIIDYFNECGYLNQFMIIILPDFFDLNKTIAMNLSICLINVIITDDFNRGYFDFYSRKAKRKLYIKGKQFYNYDRSMRSFDGKFVKYFPFDYSKLEVIKAAAIAKKTDENLSKFELRYKARWERTVRYLNIIENWSQKKIIKAVSSDYDQIDIATMSRICGNTANLDYKFTE